MEKVKYLARALSISTYVIISIETIELFLRNFIPIKINSQIFVGTFGQNGLAIALILTAIPIILYLYIRRFIDLFPTVLIVSGGVYNLFDRIFFSGVVDYLHIFSLWFNLADLMILGGLILTVYKLEQKLKAIS